MAEIIKFSGNTFLPAKPKEILQSAKKWGMRDCVVIGFDDNNELKFGGTTCEAGEVLMMLKLAEKFLLEYNFTRTL